MSKLQKIIVGILSAVLLILVSAVIIIAFSNQNANDFVKPEFEPKAIVGTPTDVAEELDYRELDLNESLKVGMCGNLTLLEGGIVELNLHSPSSNAAWLRVIISDEAGNQVGASGVLRPGELLNYLTLSAPPAETCDLIVKVLTFEPETYYSQGTANIKIHLNVDSTSK